METLGLIKEVGAYSERQYQKQDGTTEYFKTFDRFSGRKIFQRMGSGLAFFV